MYDIMRTTRGRGGKMDNKEKKAANAKIVMFLGLGMCLLGIVSFYNAHQTFASGVPYAVKPGLYEALGIVPGVLMFLGGLFEYLKNSEKQEENDDKE